MDLKEVKLLSKEIRNKYFELEKEIHGSFYHMINILAISSILSFTNSRRMLQ